MSPDPNELRAIEEVCRKQIFDILEVHGFGHTGGSLSILQMLRYGISRRQIIDAVSDVTRLSKGQEDSAILSVSEK